jgi:signal transduction histidine kinase/ligand-binding sensor domain-containing protein
MSRAAASFAVVLAIGATARLAHALDGGFDVGQYAHHAWRMSEGFPKATVNAIAQTSDGYLWLGTDAGLARFDGVRAVTWQPQSGQGLPNESIRVLAGARDGSLWIGTLDGLSVLRAGRLTNFAELAGYVVNGLVEDHRGTIWVTGISNRQPRLCAIQAGSVRCQGEDGSLGRYLVNLCEDSRGRIWVSNESGLVRLGTAGEPVFRLAAALAHTLRSLRAGPDGSLVAVADNGDVLRFADDKREVLAARPPGAAKADSILLDRDGALWMSTADSGLAHVHAGRLDVYARGEGLSSNSVGPLFEDREGNVWVGTLEGLDRFSPISVVRLSRQEGLASGVVASVVAAHDGSVWLSTREGLSQWRAGRLIAVHGAGVPRRAATLFEDSHGRMWVGAMDGIGHFDRGTFVPEPVSHRSTDSIVGNIVDAIAEDSHGNIWMAMRQHGLVRRSPDRAVATVPWDQLGGGDAASRLAAIPGGGLWIGFREGGVSRMVDGRIVESHARGSGFANGYVRSLNLQADGTLWAGTPHGLLRVKGGRSAMLGTANGLPCDAIDSLLEDASGTFWIYAGCGLIRLERAQWQAWAAQADRGDAHARVAASLLDAADGTTGGSWIGSFGPHAANSRDGKLWFLAIDGVFVLDPVRLRPNRVPPPVRIERVVADRAAFDVEEGAAARRLEPLVRDLQIDYTALSLTAPQKVQFRHRLDGRDVEWQDAGTRRQAFYTDLPPGDYRFRVIAANNSGVWNETGAAFAFTIPPAYYQTVWFRVALGVAAIAVLSAVYLLRLRHLKRQFEARMAERVAERSRIARELHDTLLQSFHGALLNFHLAALLLPARPAEARKKLDEVIDQAERAIAEGRDAVQGLRSSLVTGNDLARGLERTADELAGDPKDDAPHMAVHVRGAVRELQPLVRDEAFRIGAEALRNAFRHAHAHRIDVHIHYERRRFSLRVRDDGSGIPAHVTDGGGRTGHFGLEGMRERAALSGGELQIRTGQGLGTEVVLEIPATRAYDKRQRHVPVPAPLA